VKLFQEPQAYEEFHFPVEIKFNFTDGSSKIQKVYIDKKEVEFTFKFDLEIQSIHLDPDSRLLGTFEKSYSR
jgi:hypothetical protein